MQNMVKTDVYLILSDVRNWAERLAKAGYAPENLCSLCIDASKEIYKRLIKAGFHAEIHTNKTRQHWFVVCDGVIMDVTATQFEDKIYRRRGLVKCKKIEIRSANSHSLPWFWRDHKRDFYHESAKQLNETLPLVFGR